MMTATSGLAFLAGLFADFAEGMQMFIITAPEQRASRERGEAYAIGRGAAPAKGTSPGNAQVINAIGDWMKATNMPMLHLWARPGGLMPERVANELVTRVKNLQSTFIGAARHYVQEDQPEMIGRALADWRRRIQK